MKWYIYLFLCNMSYNYDYHHEYYLKNKEKKINVGKTKYANNKQMCICGKNRTTKNHFTSSAHTIFKFQIEVIRILREENNLTIKQAKQNLYKIIYSNNERWSKYKHTRNNVFRKTILTLKYI